ncbi:hypothetical protein BO94DRAFT_536759 [Aspergillus sclerotioniger CBS 115572]|uniref:DUF7730 domain-containing protein n=1 Tax=Aspergillus sclerotioniger CBS 115572 TaxID=1450535 RepID=A0A317WE48_9EURO|nr:hypothetical protein BO94DRAFT_536759 [Aspergillus sclerotioniger CBS 115572]PWY83288.1 hypothetical protein BO94DRAFT_536759 [Aspergillus sclerotioniger CBS 115572]
MRHFDTWLVRDPYSLFHYYPSGRRWPETIRELIQTRQICSPDAFSSSYSSNAPTPIPSADSTSQPTSTFFQRLPPEIRLMIYAHVFDQDTTIHLVQVKNKIRHVRCTNPSALDKHRQCCPATVARWRTTPTTTTTTTGTTNATSTSISPPKSPTSNPNTPKESTEPTTTKLYPHTNPSLPDTLTPQTTNLLHVCRAMYTESSSLLYRNFHFDTDDLYTFLSFTGQISPLNRDNIRSLTIHYTPIWTPLSGQEHSFSVYTHTHNDALWNGVWEVVRRCRGLEELKLGLDLGSFVGVNLAGGGGGGGGNGNGNGGMTVTGGHNVPFGIEENWVQPLLKLRGLKRFELGRVLEAQGLVRDVEGLRGRLRGVVCRARDGVEDEDEDEDDDGGRKARLAILAA